MGFPVAHCICNTDEERIMNVFFNELKEKIGHRILVKYVMSDHQRSFHNAWCNVMHKPLDSPAPLPQAVKCIWHTLRAWYKKAMQIFKDPVIVEDIMTSLRAMLHTRNATKVRQVIYN